MIRPLWFRDLAWLRGLDLNQRPLGYEGKFGHHSNQDEPNETNGDEALLKGPVGHSWFISVGSLHSRFIGFDRC
jgi:hypothetical protein